MSDNGNKLGTLSSNATVDILQRKVSLKKELIHLRKLKVNEQKQIKNRSSRNKARRIMKKIKGLKAIKGKDIDHKNGNPRDNKIKNLRIRSIRLNRGRK